MFQTTNQLLSAFSEQNSSVWSDAEKLALAWFLAADRPHRPLFWMSSTPDETSHHGLWKLGGYSSNSHFIHLILFYGTLPIEESGFRSIQGWLITQNYHPPWVHHFPIWSFTADAGADAGADGAKGTASHDCGSSKWITLKIVIDQY